MRILRRDIPPKEAFTMGETQCGACGERGASRGMSLCPECMQYVCDSCYDRAQGRCMRCGSREYD